MFKLNFAHVLSCTLPLLACESVSPVTISDVSDQYSDQYSGQDQMIHLDLEVNEMSMRIDARVSDQGLISDGSVSDQEGIHDGAMASDQNTEQDLANIVDSSVEIDLSPLPERCDCFSGSGVYCAQTILDHAEMTGCVLDDVLQNLSGQERVSCEDQGLNTESTWSIEERCTHGCLIGELPSQSICDLEPCECFVRVSWCGASAGRHGEENLNCRVPLLPEHDNDILACDQGEWIVLEPCEYGCVEEMTGTPDYCRPNDPSVETLWPDCPTRLLLASGIHPEASDRLRCAGVTANRITQTIGNAAASAGYHASDGVANGLDYTAAIDLRTRDLTTAEIRTLLVNLGRHGFAAWYRQPGADGWPSSQAPHIHAVFAGVRMKSQLRGQVRDFLQNKNGLSSHQRYRFWDIPQEIKALIEQLFRRHYTP